MEEFNTKNFPAFHQILACGHLMYCIVSAHEPHVIIWSAHQGHILGYSMEELCGRSVLMLCGQGTDSLRFFTAISQASVLKTSHITVKLRDKDGNHRCCVVTCSPAVDCAGELGGCLLSLQATEESSEYYQQTSMKISSSPQAEVSTKQGRKKNKVFGSFKTSPPVAKKRGHTRLTDSCGSIAISQLISTPADEVCIVPRQKRGRSPQRRQPANITLDMLQNLQQCSMAQAAAELGGANAA
jgi:hypothetical protein